MTEDSTGVVKERHHWTSAHHGLSSSIDGQMLITALIFDGKKSSRLHVTCPKSQLLSSKARLYLDLHFSPFVKMAYDLQIPHVNTPYQGFQNSWMHLLFCQLIFLVFWPYYAACCILVPAPWIEPVPPTVEVQSPNRWTSREIPIKKKKNLFCSITVEPLLRWMGRLWEWGWRRRPGNWWFLCLWESLMPSKLFPFPILSHVIIYALFGQMTHSHVRKLHSSFNWFWDAPYLFYSPQK